MYFAVVRKTIENSRVSARSGREFLLIEYRLHLFFYCCQGVFSMHDLQTPWICVWGSS